MKNLLKIHVKVFRIILLLFISFLTVLSSACINNSKWIRISESKLHFVEAKNRIEQTVVPYDYCVEEATDPNIENQDIYMDLVITKDDERISIRLINSAVQSEYGIESFSINYEIMDNKNGQFNTQLLADIINDIAEKRIDQSDIVEFLNASESKYPAEKYGYTKDEDMIVYKCRSFDFLEENMIYYKLNRHGNQIITYGGIMHLD